MTVESRPDVSAKPLIFRHAMADHFMIEQTPCILELSDLQCWL